MRSPRRGRFGEGMHEEFDQLLERLWEGRLDTDGQARLQHLAADDPELARRMQEEAALDRMLRSVGGNRAPRRLAASVFARLDAGDVAEAMEADAREAAPAPAEPRREAAIFRPSRHYEKRRVGGWPAWLMPTLRWGGAFAVLAVIILQVNILMRQSQPSFGGGTGGHAAFDDMSVGNNGLELASVPPSDREARNEASATRQMAERDAEAMSNAFSEARDAVPNQGDAAVDISRTVDESQRAEAMVARDAGEQPAQPGTTLGNDGDMVLEVRPGGGEDMFATATPTPTPEPAPVATPEPFGQTAIAAAPAAAPAATLSAPVPVVEPTPAVAGVPERPAGAVVSERMVAMHIVLPRMTQVVPLAQGAGSAPGAQVPGQASGSYVRSFASGTATSAPRSIGPMDVQSAVERAGGTVLEARQLPDVPGRFLVRASLTPEQAVQFQRYLRDLGVSPMPAHRPLRGGTAWDARVDALSAIWPDKIGAEISFPVRRRPDCNARAVDPAPAPGPGQYAVLQGASLLEAAPAVTAMTYQPGLGSAATASEPAALHQPIELVLTIDR